MNIINLARNTNPEEFERMLTERENKIKRALEKFRGTLSIQEVCQGIDVCFHNAKSLCDDARLLFAHKRWSSSFALWISALEEVGKVEVLHSMVEIPDSRPKVWKQHWQEARNHSIKSLYGLRQTWHDQLYSHIGAQLSTDNLDAKLMERLRQGGLYVDFDQDDREWRIPKEITKEMAKENQDRVEESLSQLEYYRQRGLFNLKWMQRRAEICSPIYESYDEIPPSGADRTNFFLKLHELRKRFFTELVDQGVLTQMLPPDLKLQ